MITIIYMDIIRINPEKLEVNYGTIIIYLKFIVFIIGVVSLNS